MSTKQPTYLSSAQLMMQAAQKRGIEVHSYEHIARGFARLSLGDHHEYIFHGQSDKVGRVSARIFTDNKVLTSTVLKEAGFPVPADIMTNDINQAEQFMHTYGRVVVKPIDGEGGRGVTPGITTLEQLQAAFKFAATYNAEYNNDPTKYLVCQQHIEGKNVRVLVVNQDTCFALERIPAHVVGDGEHTVTQLIDIYNQAARLDYDIKITNQTKTLLSGQGLSLQSIPTANQIVSLGLVANAHAGGTTRDITDEVSEEAKEVSRRLAKHFNCPIVGIDLITPDIQKTAGTIIEVNASPDISIHQYPTHGEPHNVAKLLIDMLFP